MLAIGSRIAQRFEVLGETARGGMGMVYRAQDRLTRRPVALKVLRPTRDDLDDDARFEREARLLGQLEHPGIVGHVASGVADGGLRYLVMEWVDGDTLMSRLQHTPPTMRQTVELARQIAAALGHAHDHGVVHRDVKPSNLMQAGPSWKLVDFGIARRALEVERVTATGVLVGTAGYMSPEQARGLRHPAPASDVFSLGCVLYECLTGTCPFTGPNALAVHAKIILADPARPSHLVAAIPAPLEALLLEMLAKRPEERPADGHRVAERLAALPEAPDERPQPRLPHDAATRPGDIVDPVLLVETASDPRIAPLVEEHGGVGYPLAVGGVIVRFPDGGRTEAARRGARLALALQAILPGRTLALAGKENADLLDSVTTLLSTAALEATLGGETGIWLDEATAALLEADFHLVARGPRYRLLGPRA